MQLALLFVLAAAPSTQSWQFQTDGTPRVEISNVNGSIRVEATDGDTLKVEARQEGSEAERAKYPLKVEQDGDEVVVRLCCGSCGKKNHDCNNPVPTHFTLKVPRGSSLEVASVEAPVWVSGVEGAQQVATVSGDVELKGSRGDLEVAAVGADVLLAPAALTDTEVRTVSGDVRLKLPSGEGAEVEFSSVSGSFNGSEVLLGSRKQRFGDGAHPVEVSTVSGSLEVRPGAASM